LPPDNRMMTATAQDESATVGARERVLVVEDEVFIADALTTSLRYAGFDTRSSPTGSDAIATAREWAPDLLLLDVMLPDMAGYDVCRAVLDTGAYPGIIFLSARDAVEDRMLGFRAGADDYVTKPFSLEEVVARVRALLQRRRRAEGRGPEGTGVLRFADVSLDDDRHLVRRAGHELDLSPTEYALLRYFMNNAERVLSREQILHHVWHYEYRGDPSVVETFVSQLRKKLHSVGDPLIHTVRGFGYVLRRA
jgi:two-component system, OmpR family, response regulator